MNLIDITIIEENFEGSGTAEIGTRTLKLLTCLKIKREARKTKT